MTSIRQSPVNQQIPESFELFTSSYEMPFMELIGPIYRHQNHDSVRLGVLVDEQHCNPMGICHGGMLATLADAAAGLTLIENDGARGAVTLNLNMDFISSAAKGSWVEAVATIKKEGGSIGFCVCEIIEGERLIMRATGAFKFIERRMPKSMS